MAKKPTSRAEPSARASRLTPSDDRDRSPVSPAAPLAADPSTPPVSPEPELSRLSVPYDPSTGRIAWDRMRDSTKDSLRKALTDDPNATRALGSAAPASEAHDPALDAAIVDLLYDAIGSLAIVLARSKGYSEPIANVLRYTDDEKRMLRAPTMAVMAKYDLLGGKYREEIGLVMALGSITASHVMAMNRAQAEIARPTNVAPILAGGNAS